MKKMKKIVVLLAAGALLTAGAQAQNQWRTAIEGQAYVIESSEDADVNGTFRYEWYRNDTLISYCTAAACTVPANQCYGYDVVFRRKIVVTGGCAGDNTEGLSNRVTVTFKCGGHGTRIGNLCWADRNVGEAGAFTGTYYNVGAFYQWNRNKAWAATSSSQGVGIDGWTTTSITDASWTVNPNPCPDGWRLPTQAEFQALINTGSTWWSPTSSVVGRFFGPNHATCAANNGSFGCTLLPMSGYRGNNNGALYGQGSLGCYWSSTQGSNNDGAVLFFATDDASVGMEGYSKASGANLRCVQDLPSTAN